MATNEPTEHPIEEGEPEAQPPAKLSIRNALSNAPSTGFAVAPSSFTELMAFCALISRSDLVPADYRGKEANVLIAIQLGSEIGLAPMAALQSIAVIKGRPSLWGDGFMAVIRKHPAFVSCEEWFEVDEKGEKVAHCRMIRRDEPPCERTFSTDDARLAGLWGKEGPWKTYPDRMKQMRARGFTGRDLFADAIKGMALAEEQMDVPAREKNVTPQQPGDVIPLDPENDENDKKIVDLLTAQKWTNARLEIECRALGSDKGKLLAKLEAERDRLAKAAERPGGPGDRSTRRANQAAAVDPSPATGTSEPEVSQPSEGEKVPAQPQESLGIVAPEGDGTMVDDITRKRLFATLNELGVKEKPQRLAWAFTFGVNVDSFTKIKGGNVWQFLADRAQEQLVEMKRAKAPAPENAIKNTTKEPCPACEAKPGESHVLACPECYSPPPRSGA
jgi:hypothetical protein